MANSSQDNVRALGERTLDGPAVPQGGVRKSGRDGLQDPQGPTAILWYSTCQEPLGGGCSPSFAQHVGGAVFIDAELLGEDRFLGLSHKVASGCAPRLRTSRGRCWPPALFRRLTSSPGSSGGCHGSSSILRLRRGEANLHDRPPAPGLGESPTPARGSEDHQVTASVVRRASLASLVRCTRKTVRS